MVSDDLGFHSCRGVPAILFKSFLNKWQIQAMALVIVLLQKCLRFIGCGFKVISSGGGNLVAVVMTIVSCEALLPCLKH